MILKRKTKYKQGKNQKKNYSVRVRHEPKYLQVMAAKDKRVPWLKTCSVLMAQKPFNVLFLTDYLFATE